MTVKWLAWKGTDHNIFCLTLNCGCSQIRIKNFLYKSAIFVLSKGLKKYVTFCQFVSQEYQHTNSSQNGYIKCVKVFKFDQTSV